MPQQFLLQLTIVKFPLCKRDPMYSSRANGGNVYFIIIVIIGTNTTG